MALKIAINGFGRIGRAAFKQALERPQDFEVVAINDLTTEDNLAYLLRWDSAYGPYSKKVEHATEDGKEYIVVDGVKYRSLAEKDPSKLPWGELGVDVVIESTGVFESTEEASAHLTAGAKRVVISAPTKDETPHMLMGANDAQLCNADLAPVTSDASCTTNAVVPVAAILSENPGIVKSLMSTVHGYTASQELTDSPAKGDFLRGRAAAVNIVPSSTGAAKAAGKVVTNLSGKFDAISIRVPVITGSLVDMTFVAERPTTVEEVNDVLRKAAQDEHWKGIFTVSEEPLVSTDIVGNTHGSIADLTFTRVVDGDLVKVLAWYDNEWGYTHTLLEHVKAVGAIS